MWAVPLSQHRHPCSRGEQYWSKRGQCGHSANSGAWAMVVWPQWDLDCLWWTIYVSTSSGFALSAQTLLQVWGPSASHCWSLSSIMETLVPAWNCSMRQAGLECSLSTGWGAPWGNCGKPVSKLCILNPHSLSCVLFMGGSRLPTTVGLVLHPLQSAKGACLPFVEPRIGVPNMWTQPLTLQGGSLSCNLPFLLNFHPRAKVNLMAFLPFSLDSVWIFLTALVIQECFCQTPFSF